MLVPALLLTPGQAHRFQHAWLPPWGVGGRGWCSRPSNFLSFGRLGGEGGNQLNRSSQGDAGAKRANAIWGCINGNLEEKRGYFSSVFGLGATAPGVLCPGLVPAVQEGC